MWKGILVSNEAKINENVYDTVS